MRKLPLLNLKLLIIFVLVTKLNAQQLYFPPLTGTGWETITPSSLNWNGDKIDILMQFLAVNNTKAFILLKDGKIVLEKYFGSFTADSNWYWASAGKSLTAFMIGMAQQDGLISINDSTSHHLGLGWTSCQPEKEGMIKIINQLTMTTGLNDNTSDLYCTLPSCLVYKADAGTRWAYHTAPYTLLDKVLENASGKKVNQYFITKVRSRIGMDGLWVQSGYNNVMVSSARSMARFGLLMLNHGIWDNDTLVSDTSYFNKMINTSQNLNPSYGYLWWLNGKTSYMLPGVQIKFQGSWAPDAPKDMFAALGKNGQFINIVPSMGIVMVRMGESPDSSFEVPVEFNNEIWQKLNEVINIQTHVRETNLPGRFILNQNYPNPFNPETVISYIIPVGTSRQGGSVFVQLKIFDELGKEVATLVNQEQMPGEYKVKFSIQSFGAAGKPASGIYLYRLTAGNFSESKKMLLIK